MELYISPARIEWESLLKRPVLEGNSVLKPVHKILDDVRRSGDKALKKYAKKFGGTVLKNISIGEEEFLDAEKKLSESLKEAIATAHRNISFFHQSQKEEPKVIETMPGVKCWRRSVPIRKVGLYIPGGTAPLFSTVLMLGIPASIAGCEDVILCTPADKQGQVHPAILYAAKLCGIKKAFKIGGAQAIGAMAFGTESVPKVDKIFGPGNQYVTAAKQLVQMDGVAIDMPAGPSEVCIWADETASPEFVAADLLSQAEHGADSQVLFICNDQQIIARTMEALKLQLNVLERKDMAAKALENSKAIFLDGKTEALDMINAYAPEHLIIASERAVEWTKDIIHAGSVFLGNMTPESAGDYASGTNHTLPTNGYARAYSGVSVDSFIKKTTYQQITAEGIKALGNTIIEMAVAEGLEAHANAVRIRIKP